MKQNAPKQSASSLVVRRKRLARSVRRSRRSTGRKVQTSLSSEDGSVRVKSALEKKTNNGYRVTSFDKKHIQFIVEGAQDARRHSRALSSRLCAAKLIASPRTSASRCIQLRFGFCNGCTHAAFAANFTQNVRA